MPKLTPEELLRSLDDFGEDDSPDEDMDAVLAMTPEQIQRELEAAGYTEAELVAQDEALLGRFSRAGARAPTTPIAPATPTTRVAEVIPLAARRRVSRWVVLLPMAAAFALVAFEGPAMVAWWTDDSEPHPPVTHPHEEPDARSMRREATKAMEAGEWRKALELLDRAKREDPAGDEAPQVQDARKVVRAKLLGLEELEGGGGR
jgi:hypothetical protein